MISFADLDGWGASSGLLNRFAEQYGESATSVSAMIGGGFAYSELMWVASKKFGHSCALRAACCCALLRISEVESFCTSAEYEFLIEFLNTPMPSELASSKQKATKAARIAAGVATEARLSQKGAVVSVRDVARAVARLGACAANDSLDTMAVAMACADVVSLVGRGGGRSPDIDRLLVKYLGGD